MEEGVEGLYIGAARSSTELRISLIREGAERRLRERGEDAYPARCGRLGTA